MMPGTVLTREEAMVSAKQGSPWRRYVEAQRIAERDARRTEHVARMEKRWARLDALRRERSVNERVESGSDIGQRVEHHLEVNIVKGGELNLPETMGLHRSEMGRSPQVQMQVPDSGLTLTLSTRLHETPDVVLHVFPIHSAEAQATTGPAAMGGAA